jgi:hypothetical protein
LVMVAGVCGCAFLLAFFLDTCGAPPGLERAAAKSGWKEWLQRTCAPGQTGAAHTAVRANG